MMQVQAVHKRIDGQCILNGINFTLEPGRIVGLVGRNGTGKTTLMRAMAGVYHLDEGQVLYEGKDIHKYPAVKENIVFIPDEATALDAYTIQDCAKWYQLIYSHFSLSYFTENMKYFELPTNKRISHLSKGTKLLVSTMLGLATKAKLLLLDEPTNGLDIVVKKKLLQLLVTSLETNSTIVISSHMLNELDRIADKVILLQQGRTDKVVDIHHLRRKVKKLQIAFLAAESTASLATEGIFILQQVGRVYTVIVQSEAALISLQQAKPLFIDEMPLLLEDWFIWQAGGAHHEK